MGYPRKSLEHYHKAASLGATDTVVMNAITELEAQTAPLQVQN
jgi:hypothetical protein